MANQMNEGRQPPQQQQAGSRDVNQKGQGSQTQSGKKQQQQGQQNQQRRDSKH